MNSSGLTSTSYCETSRPDSVRSLPIFGGDREVAERLGLLPVAAKVALLAREVPEEVALVFCGRDGSETSLTWAEFDAATNRVARLFESLGVTGIASVVVGLPNCVEHLIAIFSAWKLGAMVVPLDPSCPERQAEGVFQQLTSRFVVVTTSDQISTAAVNSKVASICSREDIRDCELSSAPVEIVTPDPGLAFTTGGSTGAPRLFVKSVPLRVPVKGVLEITPLRDGEYVGLGLRQDSIQLVAGPLFHGGPFVPAVLVGIACGQRIILMERFDAERAVRLIKHHRVNFADLVPTMMRRILRVPGIDKQDFSSIEMIFHGGAVCPSDVKRGWIDLVGPKHIMENYAAADLVGGTIIRGDEWLEHPGSVGRPVNCDVVILDKDGQPCRTGEVGEIFMRGHDPSNSSTQVVSEAEVMDGFRTVGDLGYLDEDGYLYIADRRSDLIISGGVNVYPAEVEEALAQHPAVSDVAVVGVPDLDLGKRVHAVIEKAPDSLVTTQELAEFCRHHLEGEKRPRSYAFVERLPRNEAGKLQRSALTETYSQ